MNADQTAAFDAFLLTLTEGQRAAFLDCLGSAVENAECNDQLEDDELEESLDLEGHVMLVAMQEAVIGAINA